MLFDPLTPGGDRAPERRAELREEGRVRDIGLPRHKFRVHEAARERLDARAEACAIVAVNSLAGIQVIQ